MVIYLTMLYYIFVHTFFNYENNINLNYLMQSRQAKIQSQINQLITCIHKNPSENVRKDMQNYSKMILSQETGRPLQSIPELKQIISTKVNNNHDHKSVLDCQNAVQRFLNNNAINKKAEVLKMLIKLSDQNNKNQQNFYNVFRQSKRKELNTTAQTNFSTFNQQMPVVQKSGQNLQLIKNIRNRGSVQEGINEKDLVRQLSFVFTNTNSNEIVETAEGYQVRPNLNVSQTVRKMINQLSDLGWLHKKIKKSTQKEGNVRRAMNIAVQQQLKEYYRWIGVIQNIAKDGKLTLRKLYLWSFQPQELLKWLAIIIQSVDPFEGNHIISIVNSYRPNGITQVHQLINRILSHLLKPLLSYIQNWVYYGSLMDDNTQFFILQNKKVPESEQWNDRFKMVYENVPNILDIDSAKMIFLTGKTINFLRNRCKYNYQVKTPFVDINNIFDIENLQGSNNLVSSNFINWLTNVHKQVNDTLVQVLFSNFNLKYHFQSMRNFFLTGKGDFIQQLYDSLRDKLSQKKYEVTQHSLDGYISDALLKCFNDFKMPDNISFYRDTIINRLLAKKIQMINANSNEAWDSFNFQYSLQRIQPLQNIFTPEIMNNYQKVFSFLWKVKQMDQILKALWLNQSRNQSCKIRQTRIKQLNSLFHASYLMRDSMSHFIMNLHNYFMVTIEACWKKFSEQIDTATSFDDIIKKHKEFQQQILQITLNTPKNKNNFQAGLHNIFTIIHSFKNIFLRLQQSFNEYYEKYMLYKSRQQMAKRGIMMTQTLQLPSFNSGKIGSALVQVKTVFDTAFKNFYGQIRKQGQNKLNVLAFKLDFSQFYSNLYIE